jgi:uncharacterized phage-like protein YoqJ
MIIAGTGHRPDKLGGYSKEVFQDLRATARARLSASQPKLVISGMALGWDMAIAAAAYDLKIPFAAYIPFVGQQSRWPDLSQRQWQWLMDRAALHEVCSEGGYAAWKMQHRNKRMVDDCNVLLALWDGSEGGTGNCVAYATKIEKPTVNVWDEYKQLRASRSETPKGANKVDG